ncbi:MAG: heme exporter protein CcmD [Pseudomonadota bacterium]
MNHWVFVIAAYAVTLAGAAGAAWASWRAMRRAESAAEQLRKSK